MKKPSFDVVIVGGGPAGLSAALVLGRCRRQVLVCDTGTPRNAASEALHGYLTRDGISPTQFLQIAREQLEPYENVRLWDCEVTDAFRMGGGFEVMLRDGRQAQCRNLMLATGLSDDLPEIPGLLDFWGKSVFNCPYCDGWEVRDQALAAYGDGEHGFELARGLTAWSDDIVLCTDGPSGLDKEQQRCLTANGIAIKESPVVRLEGEGVHLEVVVFADGERLTRTALFFDLPSIQQSSLAVKLGCRFNRRGGVRASRYRATNVPGVYVAGNITSTVELAIVAAADGAKAAFGISRQMAREDFARRATRSDAAASAAAQEGEGPVAGGLLDRETNPDFS